jgi:long-chain fatty acid transport protein
MVNGAYQVTDQFSVAAGVIIDDSDVSMEYKAATLGTPATDVNVKLKGSDTAVGYMLAGFYKLNEQHQFGLIYRTAIQHKYKGEIAVNDPTGFVGSSVSDAVAKMTFPDTVTLGYSFKPNAKWRINADVGWINWSTTNDLEINGTTTYPKDWLSTITLAVGAQYSVTDALRLRAGYFYDPTPIPENNFSPFLPDSNANTVTLGLGYDIFKNTTLDVAYARMFYQARTVEVPSDPYGSINGTYKNTTDLILGTVTYKF